MTTPPPSDDVPNETAPSSAWASPDAAASPVVPPAPAPDPVQPAPAGRRTNRFAVIALVTGLLGLVPIAVGFVVAALVQTGRRGEKGKGLAVGGLVASLAWAAAVALTPALLPADMAGPFARGDGKVAVTAMRPGECFGEFEETATAMYVRRSLCTTPHEGEVGAEGELPDIPYPGQKEMTDRAWTVCRERTEFLERSRYGSDLTLYVAPPDQEAWEDGKRTATCVMVYKGSGLLSAPLAQTMETVTRYASELAPGDCVKKWNVYGDQPLVACTKEHEFEVLGLYTLQGDAYPGDEGMGKKVLKGCDEIARKVWGAKPPADVRDSTGITYMAPDEDSWEAGGRLAFCLIEGRRGPLKRSVVPH
ncbi:septum formation family protein [Actinomadura sp. NPDC049753]|uniref:DUF4190 domain-containing protein n=1 Tax=Actinomadura sp. NPDC049753 TaxID=3154739 RepID=UPI0034309568